MQLFRRRRRPEETAADTTTDDDEDHNNSISGGLDASASTNTSDSLDSLKKPAPIMKEGKTTNGDHDDDDRPPDMDPYVDEELQEKAQEVMADNLEMMREIVMRLREDEEFAKTIYADCPRLQLLLEEHPDLRPIFEDPKLVRINFEKVYRDAGGVLPEDEKNQWFFVRWWKNLMHYVGIITNHPIFKIFKVFLIIKRCLGLLSPTKGIGMIKGFFSTLLFEEFEPPEGPDGGDVNLENEQAKSQLNAAADHMEDPDVQEKMRNMLENPDTMEEEIENDKELRQLRDSNPLCAEMMADPDTMRILVDPENLRALGECPDLIAQDFADPSGFSGLEGGDGGGLDGAGAGTGLDPEVNAQAADTLDTAPETTGGEPPSAPDDQVASAEQQTLVAEEAAIEPELPEMEGDDGGGVGGMVEDVEKTDKPDAKASKTANKQSQKAEKQAEEAAEDGKVDRVETAGFIGSLGMTALGSMGLGLGDLDMGLFGGGGEDVAAAAGAAGDAGVDSAPSTEELAGISEGGEVAAAEEALLEGDAELEDEEDEFEMEGEFQDNLQDEFDDMEADDAGGAKSKAKGGANNKSGGGANGDPNAPEGQDEKGGGGMRAAIWGAVGGAAAGVMVGGVSAYVGDTGGFLGTVHDTAADYESEEEDSDEDGDKKKNGEGKDGERGEDDEDEEPKKKKGIFGKAGTIFSTAVQDHIKSSVLGEIIGDDAAEQLEDDLEDHEDEFEEEEEEEEDDDDKKKQGDADSEGDDDKKKQGDADSEGDEGKTGDEMRGNQDTPGGTSSASTREASSEDQAKPAEEKRGWARFGRSARRGG